MNNILQITPYANDMLYRYLFKEISTTNIEQSIYVPCYFNDKRFKELPSSFSVEESYSRLLTPFIKWKAKKAAKRILSKLTKDIDIIHAHSLFAGGSIAYEIKKCIKKEYIVAVRSSDVDVFYRFFFWERRFAHKIISQATKIVFISQSLLEKTMRIIKRKKIKEMIIKKAVVIPNGIDDYYLINKEKKNSILSSDCLRFIYVGKNIPRKNVYKVAKLIDKHITCDKEFLIVGSTGTKKEEKRLLKYPFVTRRGPSDKYELSSLYKASDIFVMLSNRETFGISYIESISQGTPVLYLTKEGIDGMFPDGYIGCSVSGFTNTNFKEKVDYIVQRYEIISERCIKVSKDFSWRKIANCYCELYLDILKGLIRNEN